MLWRGEENESHDELNRELFEVVLTRFDLFRAHCASPIMSPQIFWLIFGFLLINSWYFTATFIGFVSQFTLGVLIFSSATLVVAFVLSFLNPSSRRGVLGKHIYEIKEEGIVESTDYNETLQKWKSIDKPRIIFGNVTFRVGGSAFHTLPVRFFNSYKEACTFVNKIKAMSGT